MKWTNVGFRVGGVDTFPGRQLSRRLYLTTTSSVCPKSRTSSESGTPDALFQQGSRNNDVTSGTEMSLAIGSGSRRWAMSNTSRQLDPTLRSLESLVFEAELRNKIVGQEEAVRALVDVLQLYFADMRAVCRPVGNFLFRGPTGSGK